MRDGLLNYVELPIQLFRFLVDPIEMRDRIPFALASSANFVQRRRNGGQSAGDGGQFRGVHTTAYYVRPI